MHDELPLAAMSSSDLFGMCSNCKYHQMKLINKEEKKKRTEETKKEKKNAVGKHKPHHVALLRVWWSVKYPRHVGLQSWILYLQTRY